MSIYLNKQAYNKIDDQNKTKMKKKGISPLIATILLIGLVVSLVVLTTLWGKQYILEKTNKEGKISEKNYYAAIFK